MGESSGQSEFFYYTYSTTAHSSFSNQGFAHQKLFVMMPLRNVLSIFLHLALLNANLVLCNPIHAPDAFALQQSSDVWASVVANVSPLMILVGERNAKEHMRTASSWHQFLPLAVAPLGILSIMVSAVRLSGSGFLRRLLGRDAERRSETMVELTPLSVAPANSVYTSRAVEIEPLYNKDRVAFVCAHVSAISKVEDAIEGFRELLSHRTGILDDDRDMELIMAEWNSSLALKEVAQLANYITNNCEKPPVLSGTIASASLSYRTTGISPTQTTSASQTHSWVFFQWRDVLAAICFASAMIGILILGLLKGASSSSTIWMGISGYIGIAVFTFALLVLIRSEVVIEPEPLPSVFKNAYWTFSDSRHADHQPTQGPNSNVLVTVRQSPSTPEKRPKNNFITSFLTVGLVGSYVVYYLGLRASPWWVGLGSLGIVWAAATYRATVSQNFLTATGKGVGNKEHWIGMFRNTGSESMLATVTNAEARSLQAHDLALAKSMSKGSIEEGDFEIVEKDQAALTQSRSKGNILFVIPSIRVALRTWSGFEDVMKVGLEMGKRAAKVKTLNIESHELHGDRWLRIVRFRMIIYVPGLVWKSKATVDFALPPDFTFDTLLRHIIQLLHVCMDQEGDITTHDVPSRTSTELSHVLCGPIADPPVDPARFENQPTPTLQQLLTALRDNKANAESSKFTLEQAVVLPITTLACIYDRWLQASGVFGDEIQTLQNSFSDALALSGEKNLGTLQKQFDRLRLWDDFMVEKLQTEEDGNEGLLPRDSTSGRYATHNLRA